MVSVLDSMGLLNSLPAGLPVDADRSQVVTGTLLGLDTTLLLAQVSLHGADGVWVPAMPGIYTQGGPVRVLRAPVDGGRAALCLGPLTPAPMLTAGEVVAVNAPVGMLTVKTLETETDLPYLPGTYTAGTMVHVLRSAQRLGLPEMVLGPSGAYNHENPGQPGGGTGGGGGGGVTRQVTILPHWSGSWRSMYSRWDSWNTDRYGGRSTLWQGNEYGSGPMTGLAGYGDQIVNLGASEILSIQVAVYRADSSVSAGKVCVLQPSPHGGHPGGAPVAAPAATAASPPLAPGQGAHVTLPTGVLDGFRTGAFKGLVTVGGDYGGFNGTPDLSPVRADGMALIVTYRGG